MVYVHIMNMNASMQFLLCLEMLEVMHIELELNRMGWNQEIVKLCLFI